MIIISFISRRFRPIPVSRCVPDARHAPTAAVPHQPSPSQSYMMPTGSVSVLILIVGGIVFWVNIVSWHRSHRLDTTNHDQVVFLLYMSLPRLPTLLKVVFRSEILPSSRVRLSIGSGSQFNLTFTSTSQRDLNPPSGNIEFYGMRCSNNQG